jgi:hypothetical protein
VTQAIPMHTKNKDANDNTPHALPILKLLYVCSY